MAYISYLDLPKHWGLKQGDIVLLTSDIMQLMFTAVRNGERFDRDAFLDAILGVIGQEGTLLIPTFNWDFCHGVAFDYHKTPCKTGALGGFALGRADFRRTQHPLYSFAVAGKDQQMLCDMQNVSSFGADSPFGYLERCHAKNVIIGIHYTDCSIIARRFAASTPTVSRRRSLASISTRRGASLPAAIRCWCALTNSISKPT